ncbi:hypothetical protein D9M72_652620 [compost metagenome]
MNRLANTTVDPVSPFRTAAPSSSACLNVIHIEELNPRDICSDQRRSTFMPEYGCPLHRNGRVMRPFVFTAFHGFIHGRTPFASSSVILSVIRE